MKIKQVIEWAWQSLIVLTVVSLLIYGSTCGYRASIESAREPMSTEPDGPGREHLRDWDHIPKFENTEAGITREDLDRAWKKFHDDNDKNSRNGSE